MTTFPDESDEPRSAAACCTAVCTDAMASNSTALAMLKFDVASELSTAAFCSITKSPNTSSKTDTFVRSIVPPLSASISDMILETISDEIERFPPSVGSIPPAVTSTFAIAAEAFCTASAACFCSSEADPSFNTAIGS